MGEKTAIALKSTSGYDLEFDWIKVARELEFDLETDEGYSLFYMDEENALKLFHWLVSVFGVEAILERMFKEKSLDDLITKIAHIKDLRDEQVALQSRLEQSRIELSQALVALSK